MDSLPAAEQPVCWFLAGAALLDIDSSGRRGVDLPKVRSTYWPHRVNFEHLVPGTYVVTAQLAGFATLVRENVVVREGLNLTLDLTMTVGAISETVEVRADTPLLESKTAAQGVNISGDLQRAPPLAALRTWADALTLVPGVTTSQARFQTYSLFGTAHPSGVALIDGADATSVLQGSTLYSQFGRDTFSDIQVKTGGVDASTPLGLGAVLTAASQTSAADTRRRALLSYREVV